MRPPPFYSFPPFLFLPSFSSYSFLPSFSFSFFLPPFSFSFFLPPFLFFFLFPSYLFLPTFFFFLFLFLLSNKYCNLFQFPVADASFPLIFSSEYHLQSTSHISMPHCWILSLTASSVATALLCLKSL